MRRTIFMLLIVVLSTASWANGQSKSRNWQTGTLVETEQSKVREGSTKHTATNRDTSDSSKNSTTTTTDNYETYQTYTIDAGKQIYVAREHLLFPWSKPASVAVGEPLKFAVEKDKLYVVGNDGKEHKASVVKVSMKTPQP